MRFLLLALSRIKIGKIVRIAVARAMQPVPFIPISIDVKAFSFDLIIMHVAGSTEWLIHRKGKTDSIMYFLS